MPYHLTYWYSCLVVYHLLNYYLWPILTLHDINFHLVTVGKVRTLHDINQTVFDYESRSCQATAS